MTPAELVTEARRAGLRLWVEGDKLRVAGPRRLTPMARRLFDHRDEVVALLSTPAGSEAEAVEMIRTAFGPEVADVTRRPRQRPAVPPTATVEAGQAQTRAEVADRQVCAVCGCPGARYVVPGRRQLVCRDCYPTGPAREASQ